MKTIIQQLHADWEQTSAEERYFTPENIEKCRTDLEHFTAKMAILQQTNAPQSEYKTAIYEICKNLATFNAAYEEPEYLHGFLYNDYTEILTDFIVKTVFDSGFQMPQTDAILTRHFWLRHDPEFYYDFFRIYIGENDENSVVLMYSADRQCFEFDENPYGDSYPLPIRNFTATDGGISFEVLSLGRYRHIKLVPYCEKDKIWLKMLTFLHQNTEFDKNPSVDFCDMEIETWQGNICRIKTTNKDEEGNIISMYTEGSGVTIFTGEVDKNGNLQIDSQYDSSKLVGKSLFLVYAVPDWCGYQVDTMHLQGDLFTVTTQNYRYKYNEDRKLEKETCPPQVFTYQLKTFPLLLSLLKALTDE